jgi:hypothetical protein
MTNERDTRQGILIAYRRLTGRTPSQKEVDLLLELQRMEYKKFQENPEKAKGWLSTGQHILNPTLERSLVAANAIVASTIMNSDATLTKR